MIDCFSRFAISVLLADQSSSFIISAIIGHYITVHGTPRRILTDLGKNFESSEFLDFCSLFCIFKICTTAYHPQSNDVCERFNQTLKFSLREILHDSQQTSLDLYLSFEVFSYNISVHSSTGFSPFYLTFGSELYFSFVYRLTSFSALPRILPMSSQLPRMSSQLPLLFNSFSTLSRAFAFV